MPLLDHFHAPLYPLFHWESFHSHWASILTNQLNGGCLPPEYVAAPHVKMGTEVEIDVGTLELYGGGENRGGTATAVYTPPPPALSIPITFPALDLFEILIRPEGSARLAAAIEFVSPANKDRPANRKAFAVKCASYLQEGAALIVVDIVTNRSGFLPQDVLELLAEQATARLPCLDTLYAFACRAVASKAKPTALEAWSERLELGKPLPTLPLWLATDCAIGVPFEDSYAETCKTLRIRAG
jgi:Protein of unknown function (DUF4058)